MSAILTLACLCAPSAFTDESRPATLTCGMYAYSLLPDGMACVTEWIGDDTALFIPDALDGICVTAIGDKAFSGCDSLSLTVVRDSYTESGAKENALPYSYSNLLD